ncbi:MAG: hypothetical protein AAB517_01835 [Patescibacteria group bacterium]
MNAHGIMAVVVFAFVGALLIALQLKHWRPFLERLVWFRDEKIRVDFELCKESQMDQHWSKSAKFLLDEVRQLKRLSVLCNFDTSNRVAMTEELIRKEVAVIIEGELQRALRDAQRELISAARSGLFNLDEGTGISQGYLDRLGEAYQELNNAAVRLAFIAPRDDKELVRFKTSLRDLLVVN